MVSMHMSYVPIIKTEGSFELQIFSTWGILSGVFRCCKRNPSLPCTSKWCSRLWNEFPERSLSRSNNCSCREDNTWINLFSRLSILLNTIFIRPWIIWQRASLEVSGKAVWRNVFVSGVVIVRLVMSSVSETFKNLKNIEEIFSSFANRLTLTIIRQN